MDVIIHGTNVKVTQALEQYTQEKLGKLDRYLPNISEIRVDLSKQNTRRGGDMAIAQITLRHARGAILRSEEKIRGDGNDSFQAAINTATDKMYRRIQRFKGRRRDRRRGRYAATPEELAMAEEIPELIEQADQMAAYEAEEESEIVRRKTVTLTPMNEAEAIDQMELLGHTFFMFLNGDTGQINVLYRREDGGYGILVPA